MPIAFTTDPSRELTTLTATGGITVEDIMAVVKGFKDDLPEKNILWDFSEAYPDDPFDAADMDRIASLAKNNLNLRKQPDGKTAYVATSDFVFGITRMYASYLELQGPSHDIQVFRSLDEAYAWLAE
jgi:hypothetical protein